MADRAGGKQPRDCRQWMLEKSLQGKPLQTLMLYVDFWDPSCSFAVQVSRVLVGTMLLLVLGLDFTPAVRMEIDPFTNDCQMAKGHFMAHYRDLKEY